MTIKQNRVQQHHLANSETQRLKALTLTRVTAQTVPFQSGMFVPDNGPSVATSLKAREPTDGSDGQRFQRW